MGTCLVLTIAIVMGCSRPTTFHFNEPPSAGEIYEMNNKNGLFNKVTTGRSCYLLLIELI
jgi:hypothetical protein